MRDQRGSEEPTLLTHRIQFQAKKVKERKWEKRGWLRGSQHCICPQGPSLQNGNATWPLLGATAWERRRMFLSHAANRKCGTDGNNSVKFYLTSSLRTQEWNRPAANEIYRILNWTLLATAELGQANTQGWATLSDWGFGFSQPLTSTEGRAGKTHPVPSPLCFSR